MPNLRLKHFSEIFPLLSGLDSEFVWGGSSPGTNSFWSCQIWGQKVLKIFPLKSALESEFVRGSGHKIFLFMPNLRSKIFWNFFLCRTFWTLNFLEVSSRHQLLLVTPNLRSKFFQNFFPYRALSTLNFLEGQSRHQHFLVMPNYTSKNFQNFFLYWVLWTEFFGKRGTGTNFFGHSKFQVKNFSEFFPLLRALWLFIFYGERGYVWIPTFFGHFKFEVKNFHNFFLNLTLWSLNFSWFEGRGSKHQLFLVMPNLKSNFFQHFFPY